MDRVPGLRERLFTPAELAACQGRAASLGPRLRLTGAAAMAARQAGIGHWHISLAHDGGMAQAFVVAQADHVDNDDDLTLSSQRSQARTKQQIRSLRPAL